MLHDPLHFVERFFSVDWNLHANSREANRVLEHPILRHVRCSAIHHASSTHSFPGSDSLVLSFERTSSPGSGFIY